MEVDSWSIEWLHGGTLLGARRNGFVIFWDWETDEIVRRVDADAKNMISYVSSTMLSIHHPSSSLLVWHWITGGDHTRGLLLYPEILTMPRLKKVLKSPTRDLKHLRLSLMFLTSEFRPRLSLIHWLSCFECLNWQVGRRLLYLYHCLKSALLLCGCRVLQHQLFQYVSFLSRPFRCCLSLLSSPLYLLGYIPAHNRVHLVNKDMNLYGYSLSLTAVEYQVAVL